MADIPTSLQEAAMKLSIKAFAWTIAVLWGGALFVVGILNLVWPSYGGAFLGMLKSIYPGYAAMSGFAGVIVGTLYALLDGGICGCLMAWIYNKLVASEGTPAA
jgi:hypothetical protein